MREYNAESPKQDRKRFNSVVKTIGFGHLVIIYLCGRDIVVSPAIFRFATVYF